VSLCTKASLSMSVDICTDGVLEIDLAMLYIGIDP
jgi:hypothetical protein